jgi:hypothetical protein
MIFYTQSTTQHLDATRKKKSGRITHEIITCELLILWFSGLKRRIQTFFKKILPPFKIQLKQKGVRSSIIT